MHGRGELVAGDSSLAPTTRGTAQDITERKEAEDRLGEAQRIAQVGNWEWNVATDTITWSDELYRIFRLDPRTDLPSSAALREFVHPDDRAQVEALAARARETGEAYIHQYRIVLRDGATRWIEGRGVATVGEHGLSMRGTVQDITEDKVAEERLVEAEERYRTLVEQLPLGTYIRPLDMSRPNIYASPQVEPMLGYPAEEWMTNPDLLATIVHPDDRERVLSERRTSGRPGHRFATSTGTSGPTGASSGSRTRRTSSATTPVSRSACRATSSTSRSASSQRRSGIGCVKSSTMPRSSRRSGGSPEASPTTSTTC